MRDLGWEAAAYLSAMVVLLAEVAMRTALAERPRAGRILRPTCRDSEVLVGPLLEPVESPGVVDDGEVLAASG